MTHPDKKAHEIAEQAEYVRSILNVLMSAMQGGCPPGSGDIENTIFAVSQMLEKNS